MKVFDFSSNPEGLAPFHISTSYVDSIIDGIVSILQSYDADVDEIMKKYSKMEIPWDLPPKWDFHSECQFVPTYIFPGGPTAPSKVINLFEECSDIVQEYGYCGAVEELIREAYGVHGVHPLRFTTSTGSDEALELFQCEFALACAHYPGKLIVAGGNFFMRLKLRGKESIPIGRRNQDYDGMLYPETMETLRMPMGIVVPSHFTTYDRIMLWARECISETDIADLTRYINFLRLTRNPLYIEKLEIRLHNLYRETTRKTTSVAQVMFTNVILDTIREGWISSIKKYADFKKLFHNIVPDYLDHAEFSRMFGSTPLQEGHYKDQNQVAKIEEGIDKFALWFNAMQRRVERGVKLGFRKGG